MTYLELINWARKGIQAEQGKQREMQEKVIVGGAYDIMRYCQQCIDELNVELAVLEELKEIHNRR